MDLLGLDTVVEVLPVPALIVEADGHITTANARAVDLFAIDPDSGAELTLASLFPDETRSAHIVDDACARPGLRLHARRASGVPFTVDVDASRLDETHVLCLLREVGGGVLFEESGRYLDAAFDASPIGMALFNTDGEYVRVNPALSEMLGRPADELIGHRDNEITHPDDRQSDIDAAWRILNGELDVWQTQKRFVRPDGSIVWVIANLAFLRDGEGRPICWFGQFQDITGQQTDFTRLEHLVGHDEVTGVASRRGLQRELDRRLEAAAHHQEYGALVIIDLDGFKAINDTYGHRAGDETLASVARAITRSVRETDFVGRLGGDEFAVVMPHVNEAQARSIAEGLVDGVRQATAGLVGASFGIAHYTSHTAGTAELIDRADNAMYEAKGRAKEQAARAEIV